MWLGNFIVATHRKQSPAYSDDPIAYFLTWTVYGTHLPGDPTGWRKRGQGAQLPQPRLAEWHRDRLQHDVILLNVAHREIVANEVRRLCDYRGWRLWEVNARTTHVHAVVTATGYSGDSVLDLLKANCTSVLRESSLAFADRPVWTRGGDWECINHLDDLDTVCQYVREAQDRMEHR